jgi:hypothetical protein
MKLIMENWRNYLFEQEVPAGAYRTFVSPSSGRQKMQIQMSVPSKTGDYRVSPLPDFEKNKFGNFQLCKCYNKYSSEIQSAVIGTDIPINAIYAILEQEGTRGNSKKRSYNKKSKTYDVGIAQINDIHIDAKLRGTAKDWRYDPKKSIKFAAKLLQKFWDSGKKESQIDSAFEARDRDILLQLAFAGYNGGRRAQRFFVEHNLNNPEKGMSQHKSNKDYMPQAWFYFSEYGGWD